MLISNSLKILQLIMKPANSAKARGGTPIIPAQIVRGMALMKSGENKNVVKFMNVDAF